MRFRSGGKPEVDAVEGMRSEAICMAVYESGWFDRPVTIAEIENCELEGYQKEINDKLGIGDVDTHLAIGCSFLCGIGRLESWKAGKSSVLTIG